MLNKLDRYLRLIETIEESVQPQFKAIEQRALINQARVLNAFRQLYIDETCFFESTGYGYNDLGRENQISYMLLCLALSRAGQASLCLRHSCHCHQSLWYPEAGRSFAFTDRQAL